MGEQGRKKGGSDRERPGRWEHFHHVADVGVRGYGRSREEAFEQAALAMVAVICDPATIVPRQEVSVQCQAADDELLLVDWLNSLLYEMDSRHLLFGRFEVRIHDHALSGRAWGEPVDRARHRPAVEVKGATYTALKVIRLENGLWLAQCVVDV